ncbi:hypothetical protein L6164_003820 [Bauhinia variegata]|uniref:Uncharacterized protein n=1 Tax=Bauhinia variegata TaxID=167791 RepID=A0ACB9Q2H1_BAUVA|nr:hypothetical protein L6164_003820 [Bauhinia variegata]
MAALELTVLSGENLSINRRPLSSEKPYVVVWIESTVCCATKLATQGGRNPWWNEKFLVDMPMHATFIIFDVQCKTRTGVKSVGAARVHVSEFLGGIVPDSFLKFMSYRLRDKQGTRNGIINFSVRVQPSPGEWRR